MHAPVRPRFVTTPVQDVPESGRLILRDGTTAHVRPARPEDRNELTRFFGALAAEAPAQRFRSAAVPGSELIARLATEADPATAMALVVVRASAGDTRIVATGTYTARNASTAEIALAVAAPFRGKGLGTLLLERLALLAVCNGFTRFWAVTAADNAPLLELFRASGFELRERADGGDIEINLNVAPTEGSVAHLETRDRVATVASLLPLFRPNAVAVVGASRDPAAIGGRVLDALVRAGFRGPIYPVNPNATEIAGLKAYPSVRALPEPVDLAVIAVPAAAVSGVVDDCAAHGVRAVTVISSGFADVGDTGAARQKALVEKVRRHGMRMVGPNCLGLLNADPAVQLNASFSPVFPPSGRIAMSSQSGAVGLAALGAARRYGLGFSTFVSVGNKADVSGNDLLQYWEEDPATDVILLYLESFGNPRRFARIARRVGRRKPVVVLHSGLTRTGARAAGSHTAALATNATAAEALFRQTGVIRAGTLEEMFDLALALSCQPLPKGRRVGIVTNAGGPGILCADACEASGLTVPTPSAELRAKLTELVPGAASINNPIDLMAATGAEGFHRVIEAVLMSGEVDALVAIFIPVGSAETGAVTRAIVDGVATARAAGAKNLPVLTCVLGEDGRSHLDGPGERIPCYPFPEIPARALGMAAAYSAWRDQAPDVFPDFTDIDVARARGVCHRVAAERGETWLSAEEVQSVLAALGLPLVPFEFARTADEAVAAAVRLKFPVAVKLASRHFVHKTEVDGVRLGLTDADSVRRAVTEIRHRAERENKPGAIDGVIVQPMVRGGVEVMIGVTQDPLFGPLVAAGLGGIHVEVMADVCFRVAPLSTRDAAEMVRGIRGFRLLEGYRGHAPADIEAIETVLLRVSRLAEEVPEIREIDLNPVFAFPPGQGCRIADARIRVRPVK